MSGKNPDFQMTPREELEVKLTALLLGELGGEEAQALKEVVARDPEFAALHERLKQTIKLVGETTSHTAAKKAPETAPFKLSFEKREKLLQQFKMIRPTELDRPRRRLPWFVPLAAAAILVILVGWLAFMPEFSMSRRLEEVTFWHSASTSASGARDELSMEKRSKRIPELINLSPSAGRRPAVQEQQLRSEISEPRNNLSESVRPAASEIARRELFARDKIALPSGGASAGAVTVAPEDGAAGARDEKRGYTANGPIVSFMNRGNIAESSDDLATSSAIAAKPGGAGGEPALGFGVSKAHPESRNLQEFGKAKGVAQLTDGSSVQERSAIDEAVRPQETLPSLAAGLPLKEEEAVRGRDVPVVAGNVMAGGLGGGGGYGGGGGGFGGPAAVQPPPAAPTAAPVPPEASAAVTGLPAAVPARQPAVDPTTGLPVGMESPYKDAAVLGDVPVLGRFFRSETPARGSSVAGTASTLGRERSLSDGDGKQDQGKVAQAAGRQTEDREEKFGLLDSTVSLGAANLYKEESEKKSKSTVQSGKPASPAKALNWSLGNLDSGTAVAGSAAQAASERFAGGFAINTPAQAPTSTLGPKGEGEVQKLAANREKAVDHFYDDSDMSGVQNGHATSVPGTLTTNSFYSLNIVGYHPVEVKGPLTEGKDEGLAGRAEAGRKSESARARADIFLPLTQSAGKELALGNYAWFDRNDLHGASRAGKTSGGDLIVNGLPQTATVSGSSQADRKSAALANNDASKKPTTPSLPPTPQPEVQTRENAFSTFSLNVSDVSFKLAAASLEKGTLPDAASIRSEEFINAFDYRDPEPAAGVPIGFAWERARYAFAQNRDLLRFSVKTAAQGRQAGRPLNLVLLLDNSGSMERADRVEIISQALRVLATQLQPQDKLSVVSFSRTAHLWIDGIPGNQAGKVAEEAGMLTPEGGTNLEEAMNLAYTTALRHYLPNGINRVVLLTDGAANLGDVQPESLKQKVEANRKQGIAFDCFGIGWEGYNDDLLEVLSRNGDGRYGFINTPEEAATEFVGQLAGALNVAASDVKVQVEFNPARVTAYRQIGYAKHQLTKQQFRDNTVDAAEIGAAESGNALYVVEVNPQGEGPLGTVRVRYKVPGTTDYREHEFSVPYNGDAVALEKASPAMRLAATASAFSEWLASNPYAAEVTPDRLLALLTGVPEVYGADQRPKKLEWMIRQAKSVGGK